MSKRGRKGTVIAKSLKELLETEAPAGFYPWKIECGQIVYVYARTKIDAIKKALTSVAFANPCTIEEIREALK